MCTLELTVGTHGRAPVLIFASLTEEELSVETADIAIDEDRFISIPSDAQNKEIPLSERLRYYNALTINAVLWGCESWALKVSLVKKLEGMHHDCLRQIVGYKYYLHGHVKKEDIRAEALDAYTMETNLELRRCRWLEKIANMGENRMPRKLLAAFCHGKIT